MRVEASRSCRAAWDLAAYITACALSAPYVRFHTLSLSYCATDLLQAEEALRWLLTRANAEYKKRFGKLLSEQGVILHWIAKAHIDIDAARLIVLNAAAAIDTGNAKSALVEIAQAKILVPNMALEIIDKAVQTYGAQGIGQDTPLAAMWAHVRTVRIAAGLMKRIWSSWGGRRTGERQRQVL